MKSRPLAHEGGTLTIECPYCRRFHPLYYLEERLIVYFVCGNAICLDIEGSWFGVLDHGEGTNED